MDVPANVERKLAGRGGSVKVTVTAHRVAYVEDADIFRRGEKVAKGDGGVKRG